MDWGFEPPDMGKGKSPGSKRKGEEIWAYYQLDERENPSMLKESNRMLVASFLVYVGRYPGMWKPVYDTDMGTQTSF